MSIDKITMEEGPKTPSNVLDYEGDITVYGGNEEDLFPGAKVDEGDVIGYDQQAQLHVISGGIEPRGGDKLDEFAEYNAEALDLDPVAYLDSGSLKECDNAMTGERLAELAERSLGEQPDMIVETDEEGEYGIVRLT